MSISTLTVILRLWPFTRTPSKSRLMVLENPEISIVLIIILRGILFTLFSLPENPFLTKDSLKIESESRPFISEFPEPEELSNLWKFSKMTQDICTGDNDNDELRMITQPCPISRYQSPYEQTRSFSRSISPVPYSQLAFHATSSENREPRLLASAHDGIQSQVDDSSLGDRQFSQGQIFHERNERLRKNKDLETFLKYEIIINKCLLL